MNIDALGLSKKALQLEKERPPLWEFRICAQIIIDDVEVSQKALQQGDFIIRNKGETLTPFTIGPWISERLAKLESISDELVNLVNSNHDDVFGPPGVSGDAVAIATLSRNIGTFYHITIGWVEVVRNTPADSRCVVRRDELVLLAYPILIGIEEFGPTLLQQIDEVLNEQPSDTFRLIRAVINIAPRSPDHLPEAFKRPAKELGVEINCPSAPWKHRKGLLPKGAISMCW